MWESNEVKGIFKRTHEASQRGKALSVSLIFVGLIKDLQILKIFLFNRCPYCDYRGTSASLLYHHKNRAHKAELNLEYEEKEKIQIKVSPEVQQRATAEATQIGSDPDIKPGCS